VFILSIIDNSNTNSDFPLSPNFSGEILVGNKLQNVPCVLAKTVEGKYHCVGGGGGMKSA